MTKHEDRRRDARCSFCGKREEQVRKLVAGPGVYICNECVALCNEVLSEDASPRPDPPPSWPGRWIQRVTGR